MSPATLPLGRFTVLDLTRARAGPTCVRQLVDWGATAIKIEMPGGHRRRHGRQSSGSISRTCTATRRASR
jgi:crotonobetainyl-CoA:carnitine CoA-transferase CaiB-like acyl-CoA transferase